MLFRSRKRVKEAFDALHQSVYGANARNEDAEIVTFRLQSEIAVPRLALAEIPKGDGKPERAIRGERDLFDVEKQKFERVRVWDRAKLRAGDRFEGPGVIEQFDSTTVVLAGQTVFVEPTGTLVIEEKK